VTAGGFLGARDTLDTFLGLILIANTKWFENCTAFHPVF
jgi:hypothetical protein